VSDHSPTPWINRDSEDCTHPVIDTDFACEARLIPQADYLHALHCVNSHDALVEAIEFALRCIDTPHPGALERVADRTIATNKLRAALAKGKPT
jgi:hypothetical protein